MFDLAKGAFVECGCGVWRLPSIPCWNETDRKQTINEANAQLIQAIRNFGYQIIKAIPFIGKQK